MTILKTEEPSFSKDVLLNGVIYQFCYDNWSAFIVSNPIQLDSINLISYLDYRLHWSIIVQLFHPINKCSILYVYQFDWIYINSRFNIDYNDSIGFHRMFPTWFSFLFFYFHSLLDFYYNVYRSLRLNWINSTVGSQCGFRVVLFVLIV